jgi:hypothetical protein
MNLCYTVCPFSDLAASSVSVGSLGTELEMTILSALSERLSVRRASDPPQPPGDVPVGSAEAVELPFADYDRLNDRQVVHGLSEHSQIELEAVESYEQSHQNREPVLDKLRWMRGREPLPGYDALDVDEIVAMLGDADVATIKRVRAYERKFANRPAVLDEVVRVHHLSLAARPAHPKPGYQPISASATGSAMSATGSAMGATVVNSRCDRTERGQS